MDLLFHFRLSQLYFHFCLILTCFWHRFVKLQNIRDIRDEADVAINRKSFAFDGLVINQENDVMLNGRQRLYAKLDPFISFIVIIFLSFCTEIIREGIDVDLEHKHESINLLFHFLSYNKKFISKLKCKRQRILLQSPINVHAISQIIKTMVAVIKCNVPFFEALEDVFVLLIKPMLFYFIRVDIRSVRVDPDVPVAVDIDICYYLEMLKESLNGLRLGLGKWRNSTVLLTARVFRSSLSTEIVSEVTVDVHAPIKCLLTFVKLAQIHIFSELQSLSLTQSQTMHDRINIDKGHDQKDRSLQQILDFLIAFSILSHNVFDCFLDKSKGSVLPKVHD